MKKLLTILFAAVLAVPVFATMNIMNLTETDTVVSGNEWDSARTTEVDYPSTGEEAVFYGVEISPAALGFGEVPIQLREIVFRSNGYRHGTTWFYWHIFNKSGTEINYYSESASIYPQYTGDAKRTIYGEVGHIPADGSCKIFRWFNGNLQWHGYKAERVEGIEAIGINGERLGFTPAVKFAFFSKFATVADVGLAVGKGGGGNSGVDEEDVNALIEAQITPEKFKQAAGEALNTIYDEPLKVTWQAKMLNGSLYYITVTNTNTSVVK